MDTQELKIEFIEEIKTGGAHKTGVFVVENLLEFKISIANQFFTIWKAQNNIPDISELHILKNLGILKIQRMYKDKSIESEFTFLTHDFTKGEYTMSYEEIINHLKTS
jgi:hypothetical protein